MATLADTRQAASNENWQQILSWGENDEFLYQSHHILKAYIAASYELSFEAGLEKAAELVLSSRWQQPHRYSFARTFGAVKRCDLAWRTIQAGGDAAADPAFVKQVRQILAITRDEGLRGEMKQAISRAMKGGLSIEPLVSTWEFSAKNSKSSSLGTAIAALSPRTHPRHLAAFQSAMAEASDALMAARRPSLREFNNVFVDRYGQIWSEDGAIIKTSGKPISSVKRQDVPHHAQAFFGIKATRGIYHWLVDRVSSYAWMRDGDHRDFHILLSDQAPAFEAETLKLLGLSDQVANVGDAAFVEKLIIPRIGFAGLMYWDQVAPVFNRLKHISNTIAKTHSLEPYDKIYISRADAKRRTLVNEKQVESALSENGFNIVTFTGMPLWQQFFIASNAREIVGPHGAGLSHIILCNPGTKVSEILPIKDGTYSLRFNYARLCLARGLAYQAWLEPQLGEGDSWSVDAAAFLEFLRARG
ncbi:glycosyltransferase family 61 protein [Methylobacterium sp. SD274]|uniref:glycosyltransferase family 61 protein n=1 Tax=Methylobacterium sp. SD274 TaxID=2782009 RepID=UPI001A96B7C4|nr:glycosyltransferase family 61 protein [Methylobacterium sp. SD274]MBO1021486.1 glycosyltransferase family 61 protein [Methylobacterium sp. SD274]